MTKRTEAMRPVYNILLVEDSPTDVELTQEALLDARIANQMHVVSDGEEAMAFLRGEGQYAGRPRPDLVLLDLNLPRKDGREVLAEIKQDPALMAIPVIVLTTSGAEEDIAHSYAQRANAYIRKPVHFDDFIAAVRALEAFWLSVVTLPNARR